jgi:hypothetical protein
MGYGGIETNSDDAIFHSERAEKLGWKVRQWVPFDAHQIKSIYAQAFSVDTDD